MSSGKAAVVLLVRKAVPDKLLPRIKEHGTIIQPSLPSDDEAALRDALAEAR
jgi:uncharacterized membrane protein